MIWKKKFTIKELNKLNKETAMEALDIEFTQYGDDFLEATMPVNHKTVQPFGVLHGGASCLLAETVGSVASQLCLDDPFEYAVGLEINANHLRAAKGGHVLARCLPIHLGRTTHVWNIEISQDDKLVCYSRLTMSILKKA